MVKTPEREPGVGAAAEIARLLQELNAERSRRQGLESAHASLEAALANLDAGVLLFDLDRVIFANPVVSEIFAIPKERLIRMSREQFTREITALFDEPPDFVRFLQRRALEAAETREDFEMQRPRWRRIRWLGKPLCLPAGKGQLALFRDITTEADLATDRERRALTDDLTGLANRRAGEQAVARETARARRIGRPLSFVIFDVDFFKRVNDNYGHSAGDAVLREVSRYMTAFLRRGDIAVRWGGEEFLVILADEALEGARLFAERVRKAIELLRVGEVGHITISAGVAELQKEEQAQATLVRADAKLYEAKSKGRNRVV